MIKNNTGKVRNVFILSRRWRDYTGATQGIPQVSLIYDPGVCQNWRLLRRFEGFMPGPRPVRTSIPTGKCSRFLS